MAATERGLLTGTFSKKGQATRAAPITHGPLSSSKAGRGVLLLGGGGGERQSSKRTSGSTVPQMHSSPRPHLDPQRPLPLFHARVRVGTEEPGSGPGSCWVTLSKSLRISEPRIPGRINAGPRPAEGLWFLQAHRGPSTNERLPPRGRGLTPPRWSPPAHHPGV